MPLINFKAIEGVITPEQKRQLIQKLTEATVAVYGEGIRQVTWVVIEDVPSTTRNHTAPAARPPARPSAMPFSTPRPVTPRSAGRSTVGSAVTSGNSTEWAVRRRPGSGRPCSP